jgi:hypothetical protein
MADAAGPPPSAAPAGRTQHQTRIKLGASASTPTASDMGSKQGATGRSPPLGDANGRVSCNCQNAALSVAPTAAAVESIKTENPPIRQIWRGVNGSPPKAPPRPWRPPHVSGSRSGVWSMSVSTKSNQPAVVGTAEGGSSMSPPRRRPSGPQTPAVGRPPLAARASSTAVEASRPRLAKICWSAIERRGPEACSPQKSNSAHGGYIRRRPWSG